MDYKTTTCDQECETARPMGLTDLVNAMFPETLPYEQALSNLIAAATSFRRNMDSRQEFVSYVKARDVFDQTMQRTCNAHLNL